MLTYTPDKLKEKKPEFIKWLISLKDVLDGKNEVETENDLFRSPDGDVASAKDLVGNFLAFLSEKPVTIN